jgi:CheY-like chemotaxis protein
VDDDGDIRELFQMLLEEEGYEVHTASDGVEALALLERIPRPSLIVLDYMMPIMNGVEFMKALRAREAGRQVPVVFATAAPDTVWSEPAAAVFPKPLVFDQVIGFMRRLCSPQA